MVSVAPCLRVHVCTSVHIVLCINFHFCSLSLAAVCVESEDFQVTFMKNGVFVY